MVFPVNEVNEGEIVALALRLVVLQMEEKAEDVTQSVRAPAGHGGDAPVTAVARWPGRAGINLAPTTQETFPC